jgi:AcrR family transcriptional regulator
MPKVIENLREKILGAAAKILLRDGYAALTIRAVADACGIAVGTVYNYFPSKEMLAAGVILEDWHAALEAMRSGCAAASGVKEGLLCLYGAVRRFSEKYRTAWAGYSFRGARQSEYAARHRMLVRQMADCLEPLLRKGCPQALPGTDVFLAENVLVCVDGSEMSFETFLAVAERILGT